MDISKEVTIIIKGDDKTYNEKFIIYDNINLNNQDPVIQDCINQAKNNCKVPNNEVVVKISMKV